MVDAPTKVVDFKYIINPDPQGPLNAINCAACPDLTKPCYHIPVQTAWLLKMQAAHNHASSTSPSATSTSQGKP